MDAPATYLNWAFVLISVPNLLMIVGMVVLFVAALVVPFPHRSSVPTSKERRHE